MKLDSARGLKADFLHMLAPRVVVAAAGGGQGAFTFAPNATLAFDVRAQPRAALARHQPIVATGIHKRKANDYKLAIRIQRRAFEGSPPIEAIRAQARGEVDVRYIGTVVKRAEPWYRRRKRPVLIGTSVGHVRVTAGTVGCFVQKRADPSIVGLLSNNHVLANENDAVHGDRIVQPGAIDGGQSGRDRIGTLMEFVALQTVRANFVDCALCELDEGMEYDYGQLTGVGTLADLLPEADLLDLDQVEKIGRTTGHTRGRVTAFELDGVTVGYDLGLLRFDNQIEIEGSGTRPFSAGGDSGSLIFTRPGRHACALLFAGSDQGGSNGKGLTYANPLGTVLRRLKSDLVLA